jgi:Flp pilus assembly protein TadG
MMQRGRFARRRHERERGVVLVEFAIIALLLFTLIFGIIEFGWAYTQQLDVRHGAREGARLAAVSYSGSNLTGNAQRAELLAATCDRMDSSDTVFVRFTQSDGDGDGSQSEIGDLVDVEVTAPLDTLTGFFDALLGDITLRSTVTLRSEQTQTWTESTSAEPCP